MTGRPVQNDKRRPAAPKACPLCGEIVHPVHWTGGYLCWEWLAHPDLYLPVVFG